MSRRVEATQWQALAREPEFRALLRARRRFVAPATIFFIVYYLALPVSVGWFPNLMGRPVAGPLTVAYCFAFSQFAMTWILLAIYVRRARAFDVAAARIRRRQTMEGVGSRK